MLLRNVHFASREYIVRKSLFFAGEDKFFVLLKVEFAGGIDEAILGLLDLDINVIVWF